MRRTILIVLGVLELVVGATLLQLGWQLPKRKQLEADFAKAHKVTQDASREIHQVRDQVASIREQQIGTIVEKMEKHLQVVTTMLKEQRDSLRTNFKTAKEIRKEIDTLADGAEGIHKALDPKRLQDLGKGLDIAATLLDQELPTASDKAAKHLKEASINISKNAKLVSELVDSLPNDLNDLATVQKSLGQFDTGLYKMQRTLKVDRLKTMRQGFKGMYTSLSTGADQVARLARFTYPVITFDGIRPEIERRKFWPEGATIAGGLRKASKGVKAAEKQLGEMITNLPELLKAIEGSRNVLKTTRKTIATALKHKDKLEPALKQLPQQTAKLAEKVPMVAQDLASLLEKTDKFKDVAKQLREAKKGLDDTTKNLIPVRDAVKSSAKLFRLTAGKLDEALEQRKEYEKVVSETVDLGDGISKLLPVLYHQTMKRLKTQEKSLDQLGHSMEEVGGVIPQHANTIGNLVQTGRWLVWLVAACVFVHALYTLAGLRGDAMKKE